MKRTYLDAAAAAPVSRNAARACADALSVWGNPSSPHEEGRAARAILEDARVRIARLAGVKADAVIFTANATEANALAIQGYLTALIEKGRAPADLHVLYLPSAHASTRGAIEELKKMGVQVEALVLTNGAIDIHALTHQLRTETVLVALEAVCGETGTRFDTRGVRTTLNAYTSGSTIRMHVDAAQLPRAESFELTRLASDTLSLDAQKVGGIRGIGVLIAPRQVPLQALIPGGGQERGLRPGTEAHALAAAFATSLEETDRERTAFVARATQLRSTFLTQVAIDIPDMLVNSGRACVPHILNLSFPGRDTDYLATLLDTAGFAVSTRSACATNEEGSVAVRALTGDPARAAATLRISWGPEIRARDLIAFERALVRAVRFLDAHVL